MATEPKKTKDPKNDDKKKELSTEQLEGVSGGFNPQPDPPRERTHESQG